MTPGRWAAVAIGLDAGGRPSAAPTVLLTREAVTVHWPDATSTTADLPT